MSKFKIGDKVKYKSWPPDSYFDIQNIFDNKYFGTYTSGHVSYPYSYNIMDIDNDSYYDWLLPQGEVRPEIKEEIKCTCGAMAVVKTKDKEFHSTWCDLNNKDKTKEG